MNRRLRAQHNPTDLIQVVLDDAAVDRLREAADIRGIEVEQLVVQLLHVASLHVDEVLARRSPAGDPTRAAAGRPDA